jgi:tetratricopeptide (TPR) repeat protein
MLVEAFLELGDVERAKAETERAYAVPSALQGWGPVVLEANLAMLEGRFDDVDDTIERAARLGAGLGDTNEAIRCGQHARAAELRGWFDDALRWAEALEQTLLGAAIGFRPFLLAEMGELVAAQAAYDVWARDMQPVAPRLLQQWTLMYEATLALRTGNADLAARVTRDLEPLRGHFLGGDTTMWGAAEGIMARAAMAEGRYDDAVGFGELALAAAQQRGWHTLATRHRVDLSRALFGRAGPGDEDRARALLTEAIETADALGLVPAAREARSLLA